MSVYGQMQIPCVTKKEKIDLSCSCKKTKSCYKPLKKVDKKIYKMGGQTKVDKKLTSVVMKSHNLEEKLWGGQLTTKSKDFNELTKLNSKLSKARKKRVKAYEKALKKKGVKKWKMKDRIAAANKLLLKTIPNSKREELVKNGFKGEFANYVAEQSGMKGYVPISASTTGGRVILARDDGGSMDEIANVQTTSSKGKNTNNGLAYQDTSDAAFQAKRKNYKYDTIIKNPDVSIFRVISNRYTNIQDRLDQNVITKSIHGIDKDKLIKSMAEIMNNG